MMRIKLFLIAAIAAVCILTCVEASEASNAGVARERMTAQLFAQYEGFERGGYDMHGHRTVRMEEGPDATGSVRWVAVSVEVTCNRRRCEGLVVRDDGTYVGLVDTATFRGRKGTYHETGWHEP